MSIKNLVNVKSVDAFCDAEKTKKGFTDAEAGGILIRNLEYIDPEIFKAQYPDNTLLSNGLSINNQGGYNETLTSLKVTVVGSYASSEDNANDSGKITAQTSKSSIGVIGRHAHSSWTKTQIKQYEQQGQNLPSIYLEGHFEIYSQEVDEIGYTGISDLDGHTGLLNHAGFVTDVAPGASSTLTGQELYDELAKLINAQRTLVKNTTAFQCDTMVMPTGVMNDASTKILNSNGSDKTVLAALEDNFKGGGNVKKMTFLSSFRCDDVGGNSVTVVYSTAKQAMQMRIPVPLQFDPISQVGSQFANYSDYRIGGMDILENKGGRLLTGL
jgi:hypothetical protein